MYESSLDEENTNSEASSNSEDGDSDDVYSVDGLEQPQSTRVLGGEDYATSAPVTSLKDQILRSTKSPE